MPGDRKQRGMTLAMVAISLTALLALAALAIDMGMLYTARTSAQHSADAAALAGAFTFTNPVAAQPDAARTAAKNIGDKNPILGTLPTLVDGNIDVDTVNQRVTVRVPRVGANGISMYFSSILGRTKGDVMATATAECSTVGAGSRCLKPIYIPNTILSTKPAAAACAAGERLFAPDGSVTSFALSKVGQAYNVRPSNPQNALQPSQFYSLDFGAGANTYRCTLGQCLSDCAIDTQVVRCGQSYPLKTGNMVGPTRQGVDDLTGTTPDTWVAIGQYRHDDGNVYDTSAQLVVAPVWDSCTQVISPGYNGQQVQIIGFVDLFIDGMSGSDVRAHFVKPTACSTGGGAGQGNQFGANTGPLGVPIRLVRTPQ
jgi:Putative Flp pilus-assembly TadE/G-like